MRSLIVLSALAALLATAGLASAGGWATVGFSPLPDGTAAGQAWTPTIVIKQHGQTPLGGLQPVVEIADTEGDFRTFTAAETSKLGVYDAEVVFPTSGDWRVTIHSGFGDSKVTYGPVAIGSPGAIGDTGSVPAPVVGLLAVLGAALLAALAFVGVRRLRRPVAVGR